MKAVNKIVRVLMGIICCIAALILVYVAYMDAQSRNVDGWVIIPLVLAGFDFLAAIVLFIGNKFFRFALTKIVARLIYVFCMIGGIILTFFFIVFSIVGNDFVRDWRVSLISGLLAIFQFGACFAINLRIRQFSNSNKIETYYK
jgi:hypothetical protein